jgi:hypothetical protein
MDAPEVDVTNEGAMAPSLMEDLDDTALLHPRRTRLGRRHGDEKLFPHALANRR